MIFFIQNCLSFPTVIFSGLLVIAILYWCTAALGLLEIDALDVDTDIPDGLDIDAGAGGADIDAAPDGLDGADGVTDGADAPGGFGNLLVFFGLYGVPLTIIITFIALIGWLVAYFGVHFWLRWIGAGLIRYLFGGGLFLLALFLAVVGTSVIIRPLRPLFEKAGGRSARTLVGEVVEIRSNIVTEERGEATYEDGGAGMILQVRSTNGAQFQRGDTAVIQAYLPDSYTYVIVQEDQFQQQQE